MIDFKIYNSVNLNNHGRISLKKIYHFIKKSALIGSLNGGISGAIAAILATYGYIALPGFGPIITMGTGIALSIGMVTGTVIGLIIGTIIGIVFSFMNNWQF
ncbi:putative membrane protein [Bartonella bovis m02]|uniref:Putative membrane protein n=2 Tax=Bartonella bovis TaxID=155194 RepID=N6VRH2_9HYPH|nr:putative membrane protein [Bartonella bovis m02]